MKQKPIVLLSGAKIETIGNKKPLQLPIVG